LLLFTLIQMNIINGSEFDDPEETQLLPEDQTLLVHRVSGPLIGDVLSHGVKNEVDLAVANPALTGNTHPTTPSLPSQNKRATAQTFSRFELRINSCVFVSEVMKCLISDPTGYEGCLMNDHTRCRVNWNGDDAFDVKRSGMFANPAIDDEISMQYFFMSNLVSIPIFEITMNHAIGYKGLHFWALLRCIDACLDLGITCTEKCAIDMLELYIKLLFCVGVPLDKFKELIQHPQATKCLVCETVWHFCQPCY
jgi:hypothetical protein